MNSGEQSKFVKSSIDYLTKLRPQSDNQRVTSSEVVPIAFVDEGLGNSSYLLDLGGGRAMVVDPARDATPYLATAEHAGLSIAFTLETHLHADFLTGMLQRGGGGVIVHPRQRHCVHLPRSGNRVILAVIVRRVLDRGGYPVGPHCGHSRLYAFRLRLVYPRLGYRRGARPEC